MRYYDGENLVSAYSVPRDEENVDRKWKSLMWNSGGETLINACPINRDEANTNLRSYYIIRSEKQIND